MGILNKILDKIIGKNILYYPGCLTKTVLPEIQKNYEKILHDIGIDFITLKDYEYCCGSPVLRAGLKKDFEEIKQKNIEIFKERGVGLIITNCPACYNMLKFEYKLKDYGIEVEHITQTLKRKEKKIKNGNKNLDIIYHDPCHLGRLSDVYNEPREILSRVGYNVTELSSNREKSMCCGGGGGLINNNPELSEKIAKNVLSEVSENSCITSPCPMCYYQFKKNAENNIDVKELSEIILDK